jgi:hypothetical protein
VVEDQGKAFPYTKGYWIISQLISCINPYDLDAIDENLPFSKATLDDILGRVHTPQVSLCPSLSVPPSLYLSFDLSVRNINFTSSAIRTHRSIWIATIASSWSRTTLATSSQCRSSREERRMLGTSMGNDPPPVQ